MLYHYVSKIFSPLLDPANLLLVLMLAGFVLQWSRWSDRARVVGRGLIVAGLAGLTLVAVLPLGGWLMAPLENRFPATPMPERVDGIIVLGGATQAYLSNVRGQPSLNGNAERLTGFMTLARKYPSARLVFTGGSSALRGSVLSEADIAEGLFADLGLETGRIHFERHARNTWENAQGILSTIQPGDNEVWLLVTSARHMPRAMGVFRHAGLSVQPWPVDYRYGGTPGISLRFNLRGGLNGLSEGIREWVALAVYRLLDRTATFFPAP